MKLVSQASEKVICIDNAETTNGARVLQWEWNDTWNTHRQFRLEWMGAGHFQLVAVHSGKVLDVPGSSHDSEVPIIQYQSTGGYNQWFRLDPVEYGCATNSWLMVFLCRSADHVAAAAVPRPVRPRQPCCAR